MAPKPNATDRLMAQGLADHQAGRLDAAAAVYRQVLGMQPRHADALHLLGVIAHQQGRHDEAVERIGKAIAANGKQSAYHANIALALQALNRKGEATEHLQRAVRLNPGHVEAQHNLAIAFAEDGRLDAAAKGFREVLRLNPDFAPAHAQLGSVLHRQGQFDAALPHLQRAAERLPGDTAVLNNLSAVLLALGRAAEAVACQQAALRAATGGQNTGGQSGGTPDPLLLGNMGDALLAAGALVQAAETYMQALRLDGQNPRLLNNFGLALQGLGQLADAEACFEAAVAADETFAEAHNNLGTIHRLAGRSAAAVPHHLAAVGLRPDFAAAWNNLGNAFKSSGDRPRAMLSWCLALSADPGLANAWSNFGTGLRDDEDFAGALAAHRRALRLDPQFAPYHVNFGDAVQFFAGTDVAAEAYRRALALDPAYAEAWSNLALAVQRQGDFATAAKGFDRAIIQSPDLAGPRFNRGLLTLERGEIAAGWPDYAYRFASGKVGRARVPAMPAWRGEALAPGKKLLVWREQGLGDEIMFAALYAELLARGVEPVFETDARLVGLVARALPPGSMVRAETVDQQGRETLVVPDCAAHVPAGSLPRLLRNQHADFMSSPTAGWLVADPQRVAQWRERLAVAGGNRLRVGIAWRSQLMTAERRSAYLTLEEMAPLLALPGIDWFNVQYGDVEDELRAAEARSGVTIHRWDDLDLKNDLEGLAGLLVNLDLVIAPAVSVGEMAAALAVPVWRLGGRDWTWLGTSIRPWYPTQRLFAPRPGEGLTGLTARVAASLRQMMPTPPLPAASVTDDAALALARRARALGKQADWTGSAGAGRRAVAAAPAFADAYVNLGHALRFSGDRDRAESALDRAMRLDGGHRAARANRALLRLARGAVAAGWDDYGARLREPRPLPEVAELAGRRVAVIGEQGLGDIVLFATVLPALVAAVGAAGSVDVSVDARLVGLLARGLPGVSVHPTGTPSAVQPEITLMAGDLPCLFRRALGDFPAESGGVLSAEPHRVRRWRAVLDRLGPGLKIGIAWTTGVDGPERASCRTDLADWRPLAAVPGVRLVSLQYGDSESAIADAEAAWGGDIARWPGLDLKNDLEEVAALCAALDLVIGVPTAVVELAAAVGTPAWRLTPSGDWTTLGTGARPWFSAQRIVAPDVGQATVNAVGVAARQLQRVIRGDVGCAG